MPSSTWASAVGARRATSSPSCGGAWTSWSNDDHVQRHGALREAVAHVEVDARLPLRDQRALVLLVEARAEHALDPLPHDRVAERPRGEELRSVVDRREHALEPLAPPPQVDLGPHVVAEPALVAAGSDAHHDARAAQVGPVEEELEADEAAHRLAAHDDGRVEQRLDQVCRVPGHVGDRPGKRLRADGAADAPVVEGHATVEALEVGHLVRVPHGSDRAAAAEPEHLLALAELVVVEAAGRKLDLGHGNLRGLSQTRSRGTANDQVLGEDPGLVLVGVERVRDVEGLGVGRQRARCLDSRPPVAAADRDRPVRARLRGQRISLDDRERVAGAFRGTRGRLRRSGRSRSRAGRSRAPTGPWRGRAGSCAPRRRARRSRSRAAAVPRAPRRERAGRPPGAGRGRAAKAPTRRRSGSSG